MGANLAVARTHTLLLALHLAGPFGPRPQILLRTQSIAEPGCRLARYQLERQKGREVRQIVISSKGSLILVVVEGRASKIASTRESDDDGLLRRKRLRTLNRGVRSGGFFTLCSPRWEFVCLENEKSR